MKKLVGFLALTTIGFASSTAYLASELYSRDAAPAGGLASGVDPAASVGQGQDRVAQGSGSDSSASDKPPSQESTQSAVSSSPAATPTLPAAATKKDETNEGTLMWARPFLARFDDSVQHGEMLNEAKTGIRRQYSRLKEQLNLSDARFDQLVTQLADEMLQAQEQYARCAVKPGCNPNDSRHLGNVDHSQEYLALLGANDIEAFNQFRSSISERDQVIQLRGRLPDNNFLPESQAEWLISALAAERDLYQQESTQRGATLRGWGTQLGVLYYSQDSGSPDQQIAEAAQYSQRLRTRAAGVLTPAQLAAYVQMQDELLAQLATMLRPAPTPRKAGPSTHAS